MIIVALVLFVILFFIVRSYRECMGGGTVSGGASNSQYSGGGVAGESYKNEAFLDSASKELSPSYGRLGSIFKYFSPESWPFSDYNPAMAINLSSKKQIVSAEKFVPNSLKSLSLLK